MKIGEFALFTGLSKDTIRYYEKINLLHPVLKNNQREYSEHHVTIIRIILKLKQSGFLLQEIKTLFELSQNTDHTNQLSEEEIDNVKQVKILFHNKLEQIVQKEKEIQQIKQILERANNKIKQLLAKNDL